MKQLEINKPVTGNWGIVVNRQGGVGLIEILVTVLVLGVGLLGLAALQVKSTQLTSNTQQKSQAILLANDAIERIRANRKNANDYGVIEEPGGTCETDFTPPNDSIAAQDQAEWQNSIRCLMASGGGTIAVTGNIVTVTLNWESRIVNEPGALTMVGRL